MNENVNISFIPKKPLARNETVRYRRSILGTASLVSFAITFLFVAGATYEFFYIEAKKAEKAEMIKKVTTMDPNILDMGARTDGRISGDPRHKAKADPDE